MRTSASTLLLLCLLANNAFGHETTAVSADIAIEEKTGAVIPSDARFADETGKQVKLKALIDRPTIIAPVYLHCTHTCPMLLNGLADALGKMELLRPGKDYRVVTLSFDEREGPALAREKKPNYIAAVRRPFPEDAWKFLTGNNANIKKFTDAAGFKFQRDGEDFSHPILIVILAPGGKIVRYLYGTSFLPFEVTLALSEAAEGKTGTPANRVLTYCFSYDPLKKSYVFNILKVVGTVVIITLISFFIYLMATSRKKQGAA